MYYDPSWWGRAEPIYITTCPRDLKSKVGSISNLSFVNVISHSENGVLLSGSSEGVLRNLKFKNVNLTYSRLTDFEDGFIGNEPIGCRGGLVNRNKAGIMMEHIDGLLIENMNMRWNNSYLEGWNNAFEFRPSSVNNVSLFSFSSALVSLEENSEK